MATGRFVTDLDRGDVMGPVDYVMSRFVVREYCHAVEMHQPCFQGIDAQIAPPTLVHLDKLRLYKHACPSGTVTDRFMKRGREYVLVHIDLRTAGDDRLLIDYRDTVILAYKGKDEATDGAKS